MRILGIDPGTRKTGYGLLQWDGEVRAEDWGVVSMLRQKSLDERLYELYYRLSELVKLYQPTEVAVEEPFMGKGENRFTAPAFAIGQAQAAVIIAASGHGVPIFRYAPSQIKQAVADYGRASKEQVQELIGRQLGLPLPFPESDAADALAIALCHVRRRQTDAVLARSTLVKI